MKPLNQANADTTQGAAPAQLPKNNRALLALETAIGQAGGLLYALGNAYTEEVREATGPHFKSVSHGIEQLTQGSAERLHCFTKEDLLAPGEMLQIEETVDEACALLYLFGGAVTNQLNAKDLPGAGAIAAGVSGVSLKQASALHSSYAAVCDALRANQQGSARLQ